MSVLDYFYTIWLYFYSIGQSSTTGNWETGFMYKIKGSSTENELDIISIIQ